MTSSIAMTRLAFALGASAFCLQAGATLYDCQSVQTGSYVYAYALGINNAGEMAGFSDFPSGARGSARWSASGELTALEEPGEYSVAAALNDAGLAVGWGYAKGFGTYLPLAWQGTAVTTLPLRPGETAGVARDVNGQGAAVGYSSPGPGRRTHAMLWRNGRVVDLGTLGPREGHAHRWSEAEAINRHSVIVGRSRLDDGSYRAVRWGRDRQIEDLGMLPGAWESWAHGINSEGIVVGVSLFDDGSQRQRATAWVGTAILDLGALEGHLVSQASAVNEHGTVVGSSAVTRSSISSNAVVWRSLEAAPKDLNTLVPGGCHQHGDPYHLETATGINRHGEIAGFGAFNDAFGGVHYAPFKLVPLKAAR